LANLISFANVLAIHTTSLALKKQTISKISDGRANIFMATNTDPRLKINAWFKVMNFNKH
jgi:hypothetical protein